MKKRTDKKVVFGFEFWGTSTTTTGDPNPQTGRMSIAGTPMIFGSTEEMKKWMSEGYRTRIEVSLKVLRQLQLGKSRDHFNEMVEMLSP